MIKDLFDRLPFSEKFTRKGASIVPPTAEEVAANLRDRGMAQSAAHAERDYPTWQARAVGYVRLHATVHATFLCEDARAMAEADGGGRWVRRATVQDGMGFRHAPSCA